MILEPVDTKEIQKADKGNVEEKENIQFVIPCRNAAEAFETTEEPLNFVPLLVDLFVIAPRLPSVLFRWHNGCDALFENKVPRLISFVGSVHSKMCRRNIVEFPNQGVSKLTVVGIARRELDDQRRTSICGDHMNFGGSSPSAFPDALRSVFFRAPVPS